MSSEAPSVHAPDEDERTLHKLGYAQVLYREMGGFSNFAISFTIISILAGCLTSYYIGFQWGGPVAITWGWLIVGFFVVLVALAMAKLHRQCRRPVRSTTGARSSDRRRGVGSPAGSI